MGQNHGPQCCSQFAQITQRRHNPGHCSAGRSWTMPSEAQTAPNNPRLWHCVSFCFVVTRRKGSERGCCQPPPSAPVWCLHKSQRRTRGASLSSHLLPPGKSVTPVLQLFCTVEGGCPSAHPYSPSPCGIQELVMCFIALNVSSITQPEGTWLSPPRPRPLLSISVGAVGVHWACVAHKGFQNQLARPRSVSGLSPFLCSGPHFLYTWKWRPREAKRLTHSRSHSKRERGTELKHACASVQSQVMGSVQPLGYHPDCQSSSMLPLAWRSLAGREMAAGRHHCLVGMMKWWKDF